MQFATTETQAQNCKRVCLANAHSELNIYLFNCFDWKFSINEFYEFIRFIIKRNFDFDIQLEYQNEYPKNAIISIENFFAEYRIKLNRKGFKEEDSDSYIIVICKMEDSEKVINFISVFS